jgi:hypothetical protein
MASAGEALESDRTCGRASAAGLEEAYLALLALRQEFTWPFVAAIGRREHSSSHRQNHYVGIDFKTRRLESGVERWSGNAAAKDIFFLKTFNSLDCVAPMETKAGDVYRKTLTINIDSA